ncbi:ABC transporter ATP-binding protein [Thermodesulfatator autotrophicus]|uniref:ABC transporter ATP-binding protein n=1 Tax=Thermodesulfatator autotrophicus TaxID=1795632 RepID=A0A177E9A4_9BACT|nr:ABC transporter ATP-binding protein [Thermodesulfatator autotrophicus]OAG28495.1 ABC transporter ATP-binding protein [Thermodesulfatator autotrophicus]
MAKTAIEAKNLIKVYGSGPQRVEVLQGASFKIAAGEKVAIVGASGVGKTTLLHILGTLDRPDQGQVFHFGVDVFSLSDRELSRFRNQKLGFVFQFHHLLPEFNTLENTMLPALIAGKSVKEARKMAEEILERVGLSHRLNHRIGELSGGERQRVAIARALVLNPPVLLADEPTGNLDVKTAQEIVKLFLRINQTYATTLVVVTHNPELATQMDRVFGLSAGKIIELSKDEPWPWNKPSKE